MNNNSFQKIGLCPQPAYTGPLLPNPYRMANDGKDSVPLKYADSAAGSGDSAFANDLEAGDDSLDLIPANESWKTAFDGTDDFMINGLVFRRHPKNWKRTEEETASI